MWCRHSGMFRLGWPSRYCVVRAVPVHTHTSPLRPSPLTPSSGWVLCGRLLIQGTHPPPGSWEWPRKGERLVPVTLLVRAGRRDETDVVGSLLADACHEAPVVRWLVPDPCDRHQALPTLMSTWVDHAFDVGYVDVAVPARAGADPVGGAVWVPGVDGGPLGFDQLVYEALSPQAHDRWITLRKELREQKPADLGTFWSLMVLGVAPHHRGKGAASLLLRNSARRLDQARHGSLVLVDSARVANLFPLHGYVGWAPCGVPTGGPLMFPYWRLSAG